MQFSLLLLTILLSAVVQLSNAASPKATQAAPDATLSQLATNPRLSSSIAEGFANGETQIDILVVLRGQPAGSPWYSISPMATSNVAD